MAGRRTSTAGTDGGGRRCAQRPSAAPACRGSRARARGRCRGGGAVAGRGGSAGGGAAWVERGGVG
jgi:hypothetical protein